MEEIAGRYSGTTCTAVGVNSTIHLAVERAQRLDVEIQLRVPKTVRERQHHDGYLVQLLY